MEKKRHYGMVINLSRCYGCHSCVLACKYENRLPQGADWIKIVKIGPVGLFPKVELRFVPLLCMQCEKAPCLEACPIEGALYRQGEGILRVDRQLCNGCGNCLPACPYKALSQDRVTKLVGKCDFCWERLQQGLSPTCVISCPSKALVFGDVNDATAEISRLLSQGPHSFLLGNEAIGPSICYTNAPAIVRKMNEVFGPTKRRFDVRR